MKKVLFGLLTVACVLALCACGDSGEYNPTETQETTPSAAVQTEPTAEPTEPAGLALPWDVPAVQEALSYGEYFSEVRSYDQEADIRANTEFFVGEDSLAGEYSLQQDEEAVRIVPYKLTKEQWVIGPAADFEGCVWKIATPTQAFGIRDGKEIFSVDYLTGAQQTLYVDETGGLQRLVDSNADGTFMILAEDQVLFCLAGAGENLGIYRIYLPNGQADLLYDGIPLDAVPELLSDKVYSNQSIGWWQKNSEYYALMEELNTPDSPYLEEYYAQIGADGEPDKEVIYEILNDVINREYGLYSLTEYSFDAVTGELTDLGYPGV